LYGRVVLSIYVFSDPRITDIVWMREIFGKTTYNGSERSSMESIRNTTVIILSYEMDKTTLPLNKNIFMCAMIGGHI
jgi:inhibitor of KinA sporulation pathway (predicted exonuclease)